MRGPIALMVFGMGCVRVEVELPMVCAGARDITIDNPGIDFSEFTDEPVVVDAEVEQEEIQGLPIGLTTEVAFFDGTLIPTEDSDLAFVEKVRIHLSAGADDSSLPMVDLFNYRRDPGSRDSTVAFEGAAEPVDLAKYLGPGGAVFGFELEGDAGQFPDQVVFDADLCFSLDASYQRDFL